jgi:selT/selW/selH-like putative selenoprotein
LAAEIKGAFQLNAELIEGKNGIFDVIANGQMIFSKHKESRFPEENEIIDSIHAMNKTSK